MKQIKNQFKTIALTAVALLTVANCNMIPVAGPGGVEGGAALKQIEKAKVVIPTFPTSTSTALPPKPADCVPVSGTLSLSSMFSPLALMSWDIAKPMLKIEKGKIYTKESVDDCKNKFSTILPVLSKQNTDKLFAYSLNSCVQPTLIPADITVAMMCDVKEVSVIQLGTTGIP